MAKHGIPDRPRAVRCAIYTRKSSEEGLDQEFNSLDAQRESAENYIASMKGEGWQCLPDRYDDGGFTGGNMERPALQRLMDDIESGRIDCVIVYKVDRLSRSLLDFARMMGLFEKHKIAFVSVTQQFNTSHSMGRLTLNILLSFAQFEREIISERTRDKIAMARKRGKWCGGRPILGYDVEPGTLRLVVNAEEAARVREIFEIYYREQSLLKTAGILRERGWTTKAWTSRKGKPMGGNEFEKSGVQKLLVNPAYIGKVSHKGTLYPGEHEGIIDEVLWTRVQTSLRRNGRTGGMHMHNKHGALLKGLLRCGSCRCAMVHTFAVRTGNKAYRYYTCSNSQRRGADACGSGPISAQQIEDFVAQKIRAVGDDPTIRALVLDRTRSDDRERAAELEEESRAMWREARELDRAIRDAATCRPGDTHAIARLADLNERASAVASRRAELDEVLTELNAREVLKEHVDGTLGAFDELWASMSPSDQAKLLRLLIREVTFDAAKGKVTIALRETGIRALQTQPTKEAA